jgi:protein phosphatase
MRSLKAAGGSNVGLVRAINEDAYFMGTKIWAVADGMGGQAAGDVASKIAQQFLEWQDQSGPIGQPQITALLTHINEAILSYGASNPRAAGLGTTIAGIAYTELAGQAHWLIFHIGDSRVYRLHDGQLIRETSDHSEVQALLDKGYISAEEARHHPQRNILSRCLGGREPLKADMRLIPIQSGDRMMICSDGLTTEVEDGIIGSVLTTALNPQQAVDILVTAALERGGRDNVTVIVVEGEGDANENYGVLWEDTRPVR